MFTPRFEKGACLHFTLSRKQYILLTLYQAGADYIHLFTCYNSLFMSNVTNLYSTSRKKKNFRDVFSSHLITMDETSCYILFTSGSIHVLHLIGKRNFYKRKDKLRRNHPLVIGNCWNSGRKASIEDRDPFLHVCRNSHKWMELKLELDA